ncbi:MAG: hypothetical protein U9Q07_01755 [Planctomycetota bacterium]|nr:hypothetical protein [Planctomycetota bacterium]
MITCTCCAEEFEMVNKDGECAKCVTAREDSNARTCAHCFEEQDYHDDLTEDGLCEECAAHAAYVTWAEKTKAAIELAATNNGWELDGDWQAAQTTHSEYASFRRDDDADDEDEDDEDDDRETHVKIRVSDHGTCYCSERFSLAFEASGDDHTIDVVVDFFENATINRRGSAGRNTMELITEAEGWVQSIVAGAEKHCSTREGLTGYGMALVTAAECVAEDNPNATAGELDRLLDDVMDNGECLDGEGGCLDGEGRSVE